MILTNLLRDAGEETGKDFEREAKRKRPGKVKAGRSASLSRLGKGLRMPGAKKRIRGRKDPLRSIDLMVLKALASGETKIYRPASLTKRNFKKSDASIRYVGDTKAGAYLMTRAPGASFSAWVSRQPGKVRIKPVGTGFHAEAKDENGHWRQFETGNVRRVYAAPDGEIHLADFSGRNPEQGVPVPLHHYAAWKVDGEPRGIDLRAYSKTKGARVVRHLEGKDLHLYLVREGRTEKSLTFERHAAFYIKHDRVHALPAMPYSPDEIAKSQARLVRAGLIDAGSLVVAGTLENSKLTGRGQQRAMAALTKSASVRKRNRSSKGPGSRQASLNLTEWQVLKALANGAPGPIFETKAMALNRSRQSHSDGKIRLVSAEEARRYLSFRNAIAGQVASFKAFRERFTRTRSVGFTEKNGILTGTLNETFKVPYKRRPGEAESAYTKTIQRRSKRSLVMDKVYWWDPDSRDIRTSLNPETARGPVLHPKAVIAYRLQPSNLAIENRTLFEHLRANPRLAVPLEKPADVHRFLRRDHQTPQPTPGELDAYFRFDPDKEGPEAASNAIDVGSDKELSSNLVAGYGMDQDGALVEIRREPLPVHAIQQSLADLRSRQFIRGNGTTLADYKLTELGDALLDRGKDKPKVTNALARERQGLTMVADAVGFIPLDLVEGPLAPRVRESLDADFEAKTIATHTGVRTALLVPRNERHTFKRAELGHEIILAHGIKKVRDELVAKGATNLRFVSERELRRAQTRHYQGQVNPWELLEAVAGANEKDPIKGIPDGVMCFDDRDGQARALAIEADAGGSALANSQGYSEGTLAMKDRWAVDRGMDLVYVVGPESRAQTIQNGARQVFWLGK